MKFESFCCSYTGCVYKIDWQNNFIGSQSSPVSNCSHLKLIILSVCWQEHRLKHSTDTLAVSCCYRSHSSLPIRCLTATSCVWQECAVPHACASVQETQWRRRFSKQAVHPRHIRPSHHVQRWGWWSCHLPSHLYMHVSLRSCRKSEVVWLQQ